MNTLMVLTILAFFIEQIAQSISIATTYEDNFENNGVYKIQNRAFNGVLSFEKTDIKVPPITAKLDLKNPGQRWRLNKSGTFLSLYPTTFELRPTLDENYLLEYFNPDFVVWRPYICPEYIHIHFHSGSKEVEKENAACATMQLLSILIYGGTWLATWEWNNNKLWYLEDAGDGFTSIRNKYYSSICLQSTGIGTPVDAFFCENKHEQQWKLIN